MPVHDWTRVDAGIFHDFHTVWVGQLRTALNEGLLPEGYYALAEQHARRRSLAIRHISGHRLIALVEIVSAANKDRPQHVDEFAANAVSALDAGVHLLLFDLFPPGRHDSGGMHGVIRQRLDDSEETYDLPAQEPLTAASYAAGPRVEIYLEHFAVGSPLPEMPLFLSPDRYVNVPVEPTYQAAYRGLPAFWRRILEE